MMSAAPVDPRQAVLITVASLDLTRIMSGHALPGRFEHRAVCLR